MRIRPLVISPCTGTCPIVQSRCGVAVPATYLNFVGFCSFPPITVPESVRFSDFPIFPIFPLSEMFECKAFVIEFSPLNNGSFLSYCSTVGIWTSLVRRLGRSFSLCPCPSRPDDECYASLQRPQSPNPLLPVLRKPNPPPPRHRLSKLDLTLKVSEGATPYIDEKRTKALA